MRELLFLFSIVLLSKVKMITKYNLFFSINIDLIKIFSFQSHIDYTFKVYDKVTEIEDTC